ncbi:MAG: competence protein ComEA [Thermoleophilaceae bacterium]|nr:competence protein ComEA [Thermoleophilaceae bacterium]MEA2412456.1 competence protein ComEA [Thermoleophilaceae bacterium]
MIDKRKAEVAAYAVAAFVVVLLAMRLLHRDAGAGQPVPKLSLDQAGRAGAGSNAPPSDTARGRDTRVLVVDVAGEVRSPGVYRVPAGSRADLAVQRAGGVTRQGESTAVNLAMPLHDGQQIVVPRRGAAPAVGAGAAGAGAAGAAAAAPGGAPAQPVSLSTATAAQLETLDGIGPTLAGRIVQYRDAHGGFRSIDELRQVDGIGDKRFTALRKAVQP